MRLLFLLILLLSLNLHSSSLTSVDQAVEGEEGIYDQLEEDVSGGQTPLPPLPAAAAAAHSNAMDAVRKLTVDSNVTLANIMKAEVAFKKLIEELISAKIGGVQLKQAKEQARLLRSNYKLLESVISAKAGLAAKVSSSPAK